MTSEETGCEHKLRMKCKHLQIRLQKETLPLRSVSVPFVQYPFPSFSIRPLRSVSVPSVQYTSPPFSIRPLRQLSGSRRWRISGRSPWRCQRRRSRNYPSGPQYAPSAPSQLISPTKKGSHSVLLVRNHTQCNSQGVLHMKFQ